MPDTLTWTDEPPTEPGWYWYRKIGWEEPVIGRVAPHPEIGDLWLTINGEWFAPIDGSAPYEWAGPIPEPSEPDSD